MKIKHHSIFNDTFKKNIEWDSLRTNPEEDAYYLPTTFMDYNKICKESFNQILVDGIFNFMESQNAKEIFSIGAGRACLEYHLCKKGLSISVSDLSKSILYTKKFEIFQAVYNLDFFASISKIKFGQTVLLGRIDTELSDSLLTNLFSKLHKNGNIIIFIPAQKLSLKIFLVEFYIRFKAMILKKDLIFCGYSRSLKLLKTFWSKKYKFTDHKKFYILKPI